MPPKAQPKPPKPKAVAKAKPSAKPKRKLAISPFSAAAALAKKPADEAAKTFHHASGLDITQAAESRGAWPGAYRLRTLTLNRGFTSLMDVCRASGVAWDTISNVYAGHRQPRADTLRRILTAIGETEDNFYNG